jgi:hypothetical protein
MTSVIQQVYCVLRVLRLSPRPWDAPVNGYMKADT